MAERPSPAQMPKWLLYGIIAKLAAIVVIVVIVLWYAGIFG